MRDDKLDENYGYKEVYAVGSLAENRNFIYSFLLTNSDLLDISKEGCENQVLKDILEKKKMDIENIIDEIKQPLVKSKHKIENLQKINDLEKDEEGKQVNLLDLYLKKFWFIAGLAKINPKSSII